MTNLPIARGAALGTALTVLVCLIGCGPPRLKRYAVEGKVLYDGKTVPAGRVVFVPDGDKGNRGPAAYAEIIDGRFKTAKGKGHVGGPHQVEIQGFEPLKGSELPRSLFPVYETTADLPSADSTQEFIVPSKKKAP